MGFTINTSILKTPTGLLKILEIVSIEIVENYEECVYGDSYFGTMSIYRRP